MPRRLLQLFALVAGLLPAWASAQEPGGPPSREELKRFLEQPENATRFEAFKAFLQKQEVAGVVAPEELLRQGTDWAALRVDPFVVPPKKYWPRIVPVLKLIQRELKPGLGELEVMSAYRTPAYNQAAGGARRSRHLTFEALDLQPKGDLSRAETHALLEAIWKQKGAAYKLGLGLYDGTRFHVDTHRHRTWRGK